MIVLATVEPNEKLVFLAWRNGQLLFSVESEVRAAERLMELGVEEPAPLLADAQRYGMIQIHEDSLH